SLVSRRKFFPSAFMTYRSVVPPMPPLNTSRLPSGDQLGPVMPSSLRSNRCTVFRDFTSSRYSTSRPSRCAVNARYLPSGEKELCEYSSRNSSKFGSKVLFTSRLMRLPVSASPSHRSMNTSPRAKLPLERNATYLPLLDSDGARKISPPLRRDVSIGC